MTYWNKESLPTYLRDTVVDIEQSQGSSFVKAYRDRSDGWRIVFSKIFKFNGKDINIETYLTKQFDMFADNHSYFEELCIEDDEQIIYLKDGSNFGC